MPTAMVPGVRSPSGSLLFGAGMLISGLAGGMPQVIVGRAIQGFGAGALGSVVYAAIARAYPPAATPRMIALTSSAWVIPGLIGPAIAGAVTDSIGWEWVFLGIVPPVLIMGAIVYPALARLGPAVRAGDPERSDARRAVDAFRLAIGSTLLLAALTIGSLLPAIGLAVVGAWLGLGALRHLLPPGSLRLATGRPAVPVAAFAITFAFFGTEAFVPLTVVELRGGTVTMGGIALSAAAVTWASGSWLQARAATTGIRRALVTGGAGLIAAGIGITAIVLLPAAPILVAAVGWAVAGLGMGLAYSMLALLILETAAPGEEGFSSSALQLMFTLGTALGAGVAGAIVAVADAGAMDLTSAIALVDVVMLVAAIGAVAIGMRVPAAPAEGARAVVAPIPLEHP